MGMDFSLIDLMVLDEADEQPAAAALFNAVRKKPNLADEVISQIERAIIEGRLNPGDRLPTERELGLQFGVSRTVVREALHALVARNLVEVQPGAGTVVCPPSTQTISDSLRLLLNLGRPHVEVQELVEVRVYLETEVVGLAALRRTDHDLQELQGLIERMTGAVTREAFVRYDMAFHLALAQAAQNRLYAVLLSSIIDLVVGISLQGSASDATRQRATNFHRRIFEYVKRGDAQGARTAMREHLAAFEVTAKQAMQG